MRFDTRMASGIAGRRVTSWTPAGGRHRVTKRQLRMAWTPCGNLDIVAAVLGDSIKIHISSVSHTWDAADASPVRHRQQPVWGHVRAEGQGRPTGKASDWRHWSRRPA